VHKIRRASALATAVVLLGLGVAACGSDDDSSDSTSTTVSPEDVKAPMEEVLAGLPAVVTAAEEAATAAADDDFDAASAAYDEAHETWESVEGTIKDTDPDAYEAIETGLGLIADGAENEDAERVAQGAEDLGTAVESFIADQS
jgi:hypothetical protein